MELVLRPSEDVEGSAIVRTIEAGTSEIILSLSRVGSYDLLWRWRMQEGDETQWRPLGLGDPASIVIYASSKGTSIKITPPRE